MKRRGMSQLRHIGHLGSDPAALGRVWRAAIAQRGISKRALAREAGVAEGTVRNYILCADAADRDDTCNDMTVRAVRARLGRSSPAPSTLNALKRWWRQATSDEQHAFEEWRRNA